MTPPLRASRSHRCPIERCAALLHAAMPLCTDHSRQLPDDVRRTLGLAWSSDDARWRQEALDAALAALHETPAEVPAERET